MTRPNVQQLLRRLAQAYTGAPALDMSAVEQALRRHFVALDLPMPTISWADGGVDAYLEAFRSGNRQCTRWGAATSELNRAARRAATAMLREDRDTKRFQDWKEARRSAALMVWSLEQPAIAAGDAAWRAAWRRLKTAAEMDGSEGPANDLWRRARWNSGVRAVVHDVAETIGFILALEVLDDGPGRKLAETWLPVVDAYLAGMFLFAIRSNGIICAPRPRMTRDGRGLHRGDGPAVEWGPQERYWFWHGVEVPPWVIEDAACITPAHIRAERNPLLRRCMIESMGAERCVREAGATLTATDEYGKLWHCPLDGVQAVVEVENGTVATDGTRRRYFLYVPPEVQTARQAVAWTYGMAASEYEITKRT